MTRPDAYAVAAAMNARPLPADTDGGVWLASDAAPGERCDACGAHAGSPALPVGTPTVISPGNALLVLCLPCAMADVQRAHEAADPYCTCPDCILSHTDREVKS